MNNSVKKFAYSANYFQRKFAYSYFKRKFAYSQMARVQSTSRKSEDAKDVQLQAFLLTAKGSSPAKQFAMDFLKDKYLWVYKENFDHLPQVMESDDEDLSEFEAIPEEMSEDDEEVDLSRHHAEINCSSSSDSDSDSDSDYDDNDNCFVHPASGIVAHQPPPLLHRQPYFRPLLTNKCRRRLFY